MKILGVIFDTYQFLRIFAQANEQQTSISDTIEEKRLPLRLCYVTSFQISLHLIF